jgi:uncharacterized protein YdhG (YjbR/CyaY superfamily)
MTGTARLPDDDDAGTSRDTVVESPEADARRAEVDAWCAGLVEDQRVAMDHLRAQVRAIVPEASEAIHYRVPTFFLDGPLVALTVSRTGLDLITMRPGLLQSMRSGLAGISWSGSTLRTDLGRPFPDDVLRQVVLARAEQNTTGT